MRWMDPWYSAFMLDAALDCLAGRQDQLPHRLPLGGSRADLAARGRGGDRGRRPVLPVPHWASTSSRSARRCARNEAQANKRKRRAVRGASTISQQVAKNLFLWPGRSYVRKGSRCTSRCSSSSPGRRNASSRCTSTSRSSATASTAWKPRRSASSASRPRSSDRYEAATLAAVLPNPITFKVQRALELCHQAPRLDPRPDARPGRRVTIWTSSRIRPPLPGRRRGRKAPATLTDPRGTGARRLRRISLAATVAPSANSRENNNERSDHPRWRPPAAAIPEPRTQRVLLPFEFRGNGGEYFRIWIVNLLLTIVTLGIYSAWAKVRRLRYFYGNTLLDGHSFEYHGRPLAILKGRLIVVGLLRGVHVALAQVFPHRSASSMVPLAIFGRAVDRHALAHVPAAHDAPTGTCASTFEGNVQRRAGAFIGWYFLAVHHARHPLPGLGAQARPVHPRQRRRTARSRSRSLPATACTSSSASSRSARLGGVRRRHLRGHESARAQGLVLERPGPDRAADVERAGHGGLAADARRRRCLLRHRRLTTRRRSSTRRSAACRSARNYVRSELHACAAHRGSS